MTADTADTLTVDQNEAARLIKLSAKTLGRLADAGELVGRIKIGRRVLNLRTTLECWLIAKADTTVRWEHHPNDGEKSE
ncbi:MAG: hypothetical protein C0467_09060 [Planctomycetaceae bacterium]|nr:hypothetical protein [Planctomycetaceae bacterium]